MDNKPKKKKEEELILNVSFQQLTDKIAEHLYMYTIKTGQFFTKGSPKNIGGVAFWLDTKTKDGHTFTSLMYNVHPSNWNKNRVIYEFEMEEKHFMESVLNVQYHY